MLPALVTDIPMQLQLHEDRPSEVSSIPSTIPGPAVLPTTQIHENFPQPMVQPLHTTTVAPLGVSTEISPTDNSLDGRTHSSEPSNSASNSPSVEPTVTHQDSTASNQHSMVTHGKLGIVKPNPKNSLATTLTSSLPVEPKTIKSALRNPGWLLLYLCEGSDLDPGQKKDVQMLRLTSRVKPDYIPFHIR
ncbi:hypothetical protein MRB53_010102 [Persea americana]|uniref:Uncharacterized protein n=1 Tax=Persea americana TaxID=3435 RepID=A0ACC2LQW1_PERAE|nr:hypothetical protein MRB53_010102 [Persea americana]